MPATQRDAQPGLIGRLFKEPHRFEFFQAVRILLVWLGQQQNGPKRDPFRLLHFRNSLSIAFPPSQIEALDTVTMAKADTPADARPAPVYLTPRFMGLLGGKGTLPLHYTERMARRQLLSRDEGPRSFLDLLSSRKLAQFYQAGTRFRPEFMAGAEGGDAFLAVKRSLAGSPARQSSTVEAGDEMLALYAAQFRARSVPAVVLEGVLNDYFGVPVQVRQLIGEWDALPIEIQSSLGIRNSVLGDNAVLGSRTFRHDRRIRVRIGPLDRRQFLRFVPGTQNEKSLRTLLGMFAIDASVFEICVVLHAAEIAGVRLGGAEPSRLGYGAFLAGRTETVDREAMVFEINPHVRPRAAWTSGEQYAG